MQCALQTPRDGLTPLRATVRGESTTLLLSQPGEDLSGGHLSLVMVKGLG